jgi:hypothetical protein
VTLRPFSVYVLTIINELVGAHSTQLYIVPRDDNDDLGLRDSWFEFRGNELQATFHQVTWAVNRAMERTMNGPV